ncbi:MAG: hypothetical protein RSE41_03365 [Clostridia bacterium]
MEKLFYTSLNEWHNSSNIDKDRGTLRFNDITELPGGEEAFRHIVSTNKNPEARNIDYWDDIMIPVEVKYDYTYTQGGYDREDESEGKLIVLREDTGENITHLFDENVIWEYIINNK